MLAALDVLCSFEIALLPHLRARLGARTGREPTFRHMALNAGARIVQWSKASKGKYLRLDQSNQPKKDDWTSPTDRFSWVLPGESSFVQLTRDQSDEGLLDASNQPKKYDWTSPTDQFLWVLPSKSRFVQPTRDQFDEGLLDVSNQPKKDDWTSPTDQFLWVLPSEKPFL